MKNLPLFVIVLSLAACTSAPVSVDLPPPPKPKMPPAATATIPPAGWFDRTLSEILSR